MTFRLANTSLYTVSYSSLYMLYGLSDEVWHAGNVVCYGSSILSMWDVWNVGRSDCGMFGMLGMLGIWDVEDVECSRCGMFGMWDVRCLPGCGMLIYKMPWQTALLATEQIKSVRASSSMFDHEQSQQKQCLLFTPRRSLYTTYNSFI